MNECSTFCPFRYELLHIKQTRSKKNYIATVTNKLRMENEIKKDNVESINMFIITL